MISLHLNLSWSLLATVTIFAVSSDHTPMKKKFPEVYEYDLL